MTREDAPRPGLASKRLPGTVHELYATGDLPADTPGLAALEAELPSGWFSIVAEGHRLDQQGWPLRNDAVMAYRACDREPSLDAASRAHLDVVRRWLDGVATDDALEKAWRASRAVQMGITFATGTEEQALEVFAIVCPGAGDADRAMLLSARRRPPLASHAWLAVESAFTARAGWLSYYVHRGILPPPPIHAAAAIRALARAGAISWAEVVDWARALARGGSGATAAGEGPSGGDA